MKSLWSISNIYRQCAQIKYIVSNVLKPAMWTIAPGKDPLGKIVLQKTAICMYVDLFFPYWHRTGVLKSGP